MKKNTTIYDIAKLANTSTATVSRVLSNKEYFVNPILKNKILKIAEDLEYIPNLLGRNLKTNKNREIGIIVPTLSNPYYVSLIKGVEEAAYRNNFDIFLCNSNNNPEKEKKFITSLLQKQIRGIILASISKENDLQDVLKKNMNIVSVDQNILFPCNKIIFDFFEGGYLAGEYLVEMGHKNILFVSGDIQARKSREEILLGLISSLKNNNIEFSDKNIFESNYDFDLNNDSSNFQENDLLIQRISEFKNKITAIFCVNDITALKVMAQLQKYSIKIPEDISILGFDNIPISSLVFPSISTIDQNTSKMGNEAFNIFLKNFYREEDNKDNQKEFTEVILKPKLIKRDSVKNLN